MSRKQRKNKKKYQDNGWGTIVNVKDCSNININVTPPSQNSLNQSRNSKSSPESNKSRSNPDPEKHVDTLLRKLKELESDETLSGDVIS